MYYFNHVDEFTSGFPSDWGAKKGVKKTSSSGEVIRAD